MRNAETTLAIIEDRGKRGLKLEKVYRRLFNEDLYLNAYGRLQSNSGSLTKGVTNETVDAMSRRKIGNLIEALRNERFEWTPVRRILIPKANGKTRPLGIPTWTDKLLQEVMRSILDAYYEPQFSPNSHGFRPGRGCRTAMKDIFHAWTGTKWFIEGDIKGCFDNIDHSVLLGILRESIDDNRFLNLVDDLLKAGYLEEWKYNPTFSGTPQGGIVSPLLANIYLDRLDKFVEGTLVPEFNRKNSRRKNPEYNKLYMRFRRLPTDGSRDEDRRALRKALKTLKSVDEMDPEYRRLRYIRYADDFLLGLAGPKDEADAIKNRVGEFLRDNLKLELSPDKTLITHAGTEKAKFLGYDIGIETGRLSRDKVSLSIPPAKLEAKVAKYMKDGEPAARPELMAEADFSIVQTYGSEYRGFVQYYAFARNRFWLQRLRWVMGTSMLKTLAAKHKSSVQKMARKYQSEVYHHGRTLRCFAVVIERTGKEPLIARFGGLRLTTDPLLMIEDGPINQDRRSLTRNGIIDRLLADTCEICGSNDEIQVHHIRKLADLKIKGQKEVPAWKQAMASRKRKTMVVCKSCHTAIHAGQPTRSPGGANA